MIIFGTRGITSTAATGTFHCPRCGPNRPYAHQQVKRWFTLYFIPCIPLGLAGEYVECRACAGTFGLEALHYNPEAEHQRTVEEIKRILVLTVLQAGHVTDGRLESLASALHGVTQASWSTSQLRSEVEMARQANAQMAIYVRQVADEFSPEGKTAILSAAYFALSDVGRPGPAEEQAVKELALALGFDVSAAAVLLDQLRQSS